MIIVLQGPPGSGKSTLAKHMALNSFPHFPDIIEGMPMKKPKNLSTVTIITMQTAPLFPDWLLKRKDYIVIRCDKISAPPLTAAELNHF